MLEQFLQSIEAAGLWQPQPALKRKEFLTVKGSTDTKLYLVQSGSLRIFFEDEYEEQTIRLAYPGSLIAALDSFLSEQPSDFYIQALKKCELRAVRKSDLYQFVQQDVQRQKWWQFLLEQLVLQQLEREKDILTFSPRRRYERVLARSPHLFQEVPNKYIASYLRMTPETLSRLKKS